MADSAGSGGPGITELASWLGESPDSPIVRHTRPVDGVDSVFDVKVVNQQPHTDVALGKVAAVFMPRVGPFDLVDYGNVFAADPSIDIFDERGIDRAGAIVVVRPDQYVAQVLPLTGTRDLAAFFAPIMRTMNSFDADAVHSRVVTETGPSVGAVLPLPDGHVSDAR